MLECFHELKKRFAVGRQRVHHFAASIFFIQKAGVNQGTSMLGNGLKVRCKRIGNFFNRNAVVFLYDKHDSNAPMIRRTLKISFQLFCRFHILYNITTTATFQHSAECWNVVIRALIGVMRYQIVLLTLFSGQRVAFYTLVPPTISQRFVFESGEAE